MVCRSQTLRKSNGHFEFDGSSMTHKVGKWSCLLLCSIPDSFNSSLLTSGNRRDQLLEFCATEGPIEASSCSTLLDLLCCFCFMMRHILVKGLDCSSAIPTLFCYEAMLLL